MKKRLFSILLILCMVIGLLPIVAAADENAINISDMTTATEETGSGWSYIAEADSTDAGKYNGTLTLNNYSYNGTSNAITFDNTANLKTLNIVLTGSSTISETIKLTGATGETNRLGTLHLPGDTDVVISGDGSLTLNSYLTDAGTYSAQFSAGIMLGKYEGDGSGTGGDLTIESGSVTINTNRQNGIRMDCGALNVTGGQLTIVSSSGSNIDYEEYIKGLYLVGGALNVTGGAVDITTNATGISSHATAIHAKEGSDITVTGGSVKATANAKGGGTIQPLTFSRPSS